MSKSLLQRQFNVRSLCRGPSFCDLRLKIGSKVAFGYLLRPFHSIFSRISSKIWASTERSYVKLALLRYLLFAGALLLLPSCSSHTPKTKQELRLNIYTEPPSLDPRKATDATSMNVLIMLFEGLTRIGEDHQPHPAAAESISISPDGCTYTFVLRESYWTNGEPVTAQDFLYTWQTILDPKFPSTFAYKLYPIVNAAEIKHGKLPLSALGVEVPNDTTLIVRLNYPTPYFLELTSFPTFYPINRKIDQKNSSWADEAGPDYVTNGPFRMSTWNHESDIVATANPTYWDKKAVKLDTLHLTMIDDTTTEYYMYEMGELDWAGSPLSNLPPEFIPALRQEGIAIFYPASAVYYYKLNTLKYPLNNSNIRKALGYAINRLDIVEHITQAGQMAATCLVPPMPGWTPYDLFRDGDIQQAKKLFAEALEELEITAKEFPKLTLTYNTNREHQKIAQAIQNQWREILGIEVELQHFDWKVYLAKLNTQDFQIARMGWVGDFNDPVSFLEPFKYKDDTKGGDNGTGWEDPHYQELLNWAQQELDRTKRERYLHQAETRLISEMPIIPIYFLMYAYLKKPYVHGVYLSPLGTIDLKKAYINGGGI